MKIVLRIVGVLVLASLVFVIAGVLATWAPDKTVDQLSARWAAAPSQFVLVNGLQVHVRDTGPRDDVNPIVLLHGTSASLHTWDGWAKELEGTRRVVRFDLPGFGLTGPNPENDYSIGVYVRFVLATLDALGIKNCVLAGNSLGGQIAWETALAAPQRISKLVLIDAAGYPMQPQSVPIGFRIARMPGMRVLMEHVLPRGIIESSLRNVYGDPSKVTADLVDRYYDMTLRAGNRAAVGQRFQQIAPDESSRIQAIHTPTLILWGAKDRLIPLENAKHFEADIKGSQLVVYENLGHVPHEEDALKTAASVKTFLAIK
jgi:pimeloyl-ACP methyl ester carboxylesterase